jgi:hypothetical protein
MRLSNALFAGAMGAVFFAALPLISVFAAGHLAALTGCDLDPGFASRCLVAGVDIGPTLFQMRIAAMIFILPLFYIPIGFGLAMWGASTLMRGRKDASRNPPVTPLFWFLYFAAMLAPYTLAIAIALMLAAGLFIWRKKRVTAGHDTAS